MIYANPLKNYKPDLIRTPFVKLKAGWSLMLVEDKALAWGHRFDAGIGYRVFIKWTDSAISNVFPSSEAKKLATMISQRETNEDILNIGIQLKRLAAEVDRLNKAWAAAGAPDLPLHETAPGGTA